MTDITWKLEIALVTFDIYFYNDDAIDIEVAIVAIGISKTTIDNHSYFARGVLLDSFHGHFNALHIWTQVVSATTQLVVDSVREMRVVTFHSILFHSNANRVTL